MPLAFFDLFGIWSLGFVWDLVVFGFGICHCYIPLPPLQRGTFMDSRINTVDALHGIQTCEVSDIRQVQVLLRIFLNLTGLIALESLTP